MRVLTVTSDGDYGALTFEQEFKGTPVIDVIKINYERKFRD